MGRPAKDTMAVKLTITRELYQKLCVLGMEIGETDKVPGGYTPEFMAGTYIAAAVHTDWRKRGAPPLFPNNPAEGPKLPQDESPQAGATPPAGQAVDNRKSKR